ncbi:hypothetical protein [Sphingobacterium sp.]|uniref:hypothetical protein n=1 Tax=Sphingobacterium sp. TaxID=341027 RepID=UPI0031D52266
MQFIEDWLRLPPHTAAVVLLKAEKDLLFKFVTLREDGILLQGSMPLLFDPYTVQINEIAEICKFCYLTCKEIPEPRTDLNIVLRELKDLPSTVIDKKH